MQQPKKSTVPWLLIIGSVLTFAAGVPVLAVIIREIEPGRQKSPESMAMDHSGPEIPKTGPFVTAHCPEPCRLGSYLKLIAGRTEKPGFLALYAEDRLKNRVWYFPTTSGSMPEVAARPDVHVLSDAVKLVEDHKSEREWTLNLFLVDRPISRTEVDSVEPARIIAKDSLKLVLGQGKR